jgi:hypothetical protein
MPRYVWDAEAQTLVELSADAPPPAVAFQIMRDLPGYKSPAGTGWIEGRAARREDLKRTGCREVDPSEFKPAYRNPHFATKRGLRLAED